MLAGMLPKRSRVIQEPRPYGDRNGFRISGKNCPLEQREGRREGGHSGNRWRQVWVWWKVLEF